MDPVNAGLGLGDKTVGILDKLLGPWFTRRQADANTHVALQEVLTDQAAAYMEEHPNDPVMMEAIMSCHGRFGFDNIVRIVRLGIPQLNEEARPDLISDDWGANFKDKAHTCSDPEMAELWAQLLATEANHPGSFSRKTVNVLADLEPDDARLFKVLCDFRLTPVDVVKRSTSGGELEASFRRASGDSKLVVLDDRHAVYTAMGINFHSLARLEWLGLIRYVTPLVRRTTQPRSVFVLSTWQWSVVPRLQRLYPLWKGRVRACRDAIIRTVYAIGNSRWLRRLHRRVLERPRRACCSYAI